MVDKQTSDERLLKLIEGGSGTGTGKRPPIVPGIKKMKLGQGKFSLPDFKTKFKSFKISLFIVNKGLIGLAILLTVIFLYTLFSGSVISKSKDALFNLEDASAIVKLISGGKDQLTRKNVTGQGLQRNFFLPFGTKAIVPAEEEGLNITEEIKTLKLVGIIWSQNPEVMIENSKDQRTYTLKKGDSLNDQFKIKDISTNSAVLEVSTGAGIKEYTLR